VNITLPLEKHDLPPRPAAMLVRLQEAMTGLAEPTTPPRPPPAAESSSFFKPDAFSNPAYVRHAVKTTMAAMFCYFLYQMLDWPAIHTCMITCYIVLLGTTGETVQKLTLRIAGCLIGAAAGILALVFVVPHLSSIDGLLASVFVGILPAAWIAVGPPRIAYAGFQIAFALLLCLIQGSGPGTDMVTARDRVIGVLIGNVVVFVISVTVWPVSVGSRLEGGFSAIVRSLCTLATAPDRDGAHRATVEAQTHIGTVESDLELIRHEPSDVRPPEAVISGWTNAIGDLRSLCGLLLLNGPSARAGARLAALSHEEPQIPSGAESETFAPLLDLHLERLAAGIAADADQVRDALA
jgi:multidrug resistance protein MdtO